MQNPAPTIVCHAGSSSDPTHADGPRLACGRGLDEIAKGRDALAAAVSATRCLEDDERFNAGTGSNLRLDGTTIQMDAACMRGSGEFGAVAAIERVKNPIDVALLVLDTPHILLAGDGATTFARRAGFEDFDPTTSGARERLRAATSAAGDTVGCVAWDGEGFAGALSSGGTATVLRGRVGDVPLPGCGLYVGEHGAVAATGDGEYIATALLAYRSYLELERGRAPAEVVRWALGQLAPTVDVGLIILGHSGFAGGARHGMAWCGEFLEVRS